MENINIYLANTLAFYKVIIGVKNDRIVLTKLVQCLTVTPYRILILKARTEADSLIKEKKG